MNLQNQESRNIFQELVDNLKDAIVNAEDESVIDDNEIQSVEVNSEQDSDFSWYYEESEDNEKAKKEVNYCSKENINEIISEAEKDIVIKVNKDVKLSSALIFENSGVEYTLDIDGHTLTVKENNRFIDVEKDANVTVKNGTLKGGNNTKIIYPSTEGMTLNEQIQANIAAIKKCNGVICCCGGTLILDNLNIEGNKSKSDGVVYVEGGELIVNNSNIKNNTAEKGGGIDLTTNAKCKITNCMIEHNNQNSSDKFSGGTGIYIYDSSLEADRLKVISNGQNSQTVCAGIFVQNSNSASNESVTLNNSIISDNYGCGSSVRAFGTGMTIAGGNVTLNNTIIKDNTGCSCGGLGIYPSNGNVEFNMNGGAIYNNIALNTENGIYANDIEIQEYNNKKIIVKIPAASEMKSNEKDMDFSEFCWGCIEGQEAYCKKECCIKLELNCESSNNKYLYSATTVKDCCIAEIGGEKYTTIEEAIKKAKDGETIKLIAGDNDRVGPTINEKVEINESIDEETNEETSSTTNVQVQEQAEEPKDEESNTNGKKSITIDLNGKKWTGGNTMFNALTLDNENIDITITGEGSISSIDLKEGNLTLDSNASISTICLAEGKYVTIGENFPTDKLESTISFKLNVSLEGDSKENLDEKLEQDLQNTLEESQKKEFQRIY